MVDVQADQECGAVAVNSGLVIVGMFIAGAVWWADRRRPRSRTSLLASRRRLEPVAQRSKPATAASRGLDRRVVILSCALGGLGAWLVFGGVLGAGLGIALAVIGPRVLRKFEPAEVRGRRTTLEAQAAMVADLMAACLASGTSLPAATRATAEALGGPAADVLNRCVVQFNLGANPHRVWEPLAQEESLSPIARAILRSTETGAPLTDVLLRVADDLRVQRRAMLEQAAKTVGIKAVAPLGICFLPAFMLLGVVPLIASLVTSGIV